MTRRMKAHYGDKKILAGTPVMLVKSRGKMDFVTPQEILEDLYGKPVERIIFRE
ncbi:MAG: hypothetical protein K6E38_07990 [Fretibacterium sp.]|nr:hypothetical protein [Fretibacterium sp.]